MKNKNIVVLLTIINLLSAPILVSAFHIPDPAPHQRHAVTYSLTGISVPSIGQYHLEGWAIFDDGYISTGKFTVDSNGIMRDLSGQQKDTFFVPADLSQAISFEITIEPQGDTDNLTSGIVLLSGPLMANSSRLSFPIDFTQANGTYILATPSNGGETNENSGIWFLQLPEPPTVGLNLPNLTSGWVYEGWVIHDDIPITTGRFTDPNGADNFDGYSASTDYPPFPGEDFLQNPPAGVTFPIDLGDGTSRAVISVEPDINGVDPTGVAPFSVRPLVGNIPLDAMDHVNYDMGLNLESLPSGLAVITISVRPETPEPPSGEDPTLEERILELEQNNTDLRESNQELQNEANRLQERINSLTNSIGTWQILTFAALVIGLGGGYLVVRLTQHDVREHH